KKLALRLDAMGRRAESDEATRKAAGLSRKLHLPVPAPSTACAPDTRVPCQPSPPPFQPAPAGSQFDLSARAKRAHGLQLRRDDMKRSGHRAKYGYDVAFPSAGEDRE